MCLIIHNPKNVEIDIDTFDSAYCTNPDGFGIFYHDNGEIQTTMDYDDMFKLMYSSRPFTAHFRYATSGVIDEESCHPFEIDDRYWLMMNGTIERLVSKTKVDTELLCGILSGLSYKQMVDVLSTYECRFALLDTKKNKATIINRDLWHDEDEVMYSKDNIFKYTKVYAAGAKRGAYSYGGGCTYGGYEEEDDCYSPWAARQAQLRALPDADEPPTEGELEYIETEIEEEETEDPTVVDDLAFEFPDDLPLLDGEEPHVSTRIAVYGTLKEGHGNHRLLVGAEFLGHGTTLDAYPMISGGGCPFLIDDRDIGHNVVVEVYRIGPEELFCIDGLEGHPDFYQRKVKPIMMDDDCSIIDCNIYMIPKNKADHYMQYSKRADGTVQMLKSY